MKSIRKVIIENFQVHHNRTFDFVDGINVIVGESDKGKSAVFRAIMWVLQNKPEGLGFISSGKKQAKVSIQFNDGLEIVRVRSSTVNQYQIIENGETMKLDNFGKGVPINVSEKIGFSPVEIGGDELDLNFAKQLDPPFLITPSVSSAGRMKIINQLSGVGPMSQIIGGLNKDITNAGREITKVEALKTSYQEQMEGLSDKTVKLNEFISETEPFVLSFQKDIEILDLLYSFEGALFDLGNFGERLKRFNTYSINLGSMIENIEINISKVYETKRKRNY